MADTPIKISSVMEICFAIKDAGLTDKFIQEMGRGGAFVTVDENTMQLVQSFFAANQLDTTTFGASVRGMRMRGCPDYNCPHVYSP